MQVFLDYFFGHIEPIIMWLSVFFLVISSGYFVWVHFFRKEVAEEADPNRVAELEEMLKKVLSQAELVTSADKSAADAGGEASGASAEEIVAAKEEMENLKTQLSGKENEIKKLSTELSAAKASSGDNAGLEDKIAELEARLAEYEIIEDDIADLSKYKDENARLKDELGKLKGGDSSPAAAEPTEAEPPAAAEPEPPAAAEPEPPAAAELEKKSDPITDDLINEFELAVNEQLPPDDGGGPSLAGEVGEEIEIEAPDSEEVATDSGAESSDSEPVNPLTAAASADSAAAELVAKAEQPKEATKVEAKVEAPQEEVAEPEATEDDLDDDILAEFAPSDDDAPEEVGGSANLEASVDTDRMLEEMAELETVDTSETDATVLDKELDIEKMTNEASTLTDDKK